MLDYKFNNQTKRTSAAWARLYGVDLLDYVGFPSLDYFNKVYINSTDFLTMAGNCKINRPENATRRDASKLKRKLMPKD